MTALFAGKYSCEAAFYHSDDILCSFVILFVATFRKWGMLTKVRDMHTPCILINMSAALKSRNNPGDVLWLLCIRTGLHQAVRK